MRTSAPPTSSFSTARVRPGLPHSCRTRSLWSRTTSTSLLKRWASRNQHGLSSLQALTYSTARPRAGYPHIGKGKGTTSLRTPRGTHGQISTGGSFFVCRIPFPYTQTRKPRKRAFSRGDFLGFGGVRGAEDRPCDSASSGDRPFVPIMGGNAVGPETPGVTTPAGATDIATAHQAEDQHGGPDPEAGRANEGPLSGCRRRLVLRSNHHSQAARDTQTVCSFRCQSMMLK